MAESNYSVELDRRKDELIENVEELRGNLPESEQENIDIWLNDLKNRGETQDEKVNRNEYLERLIKNLTEDKKLKPPFNQDPPNKALPPLYYFDQEPTKQGKKLSYTLKKIPPPKKRSVSGNGKPKKMKEKPVVKPRKNLYEDTTEIARVIARSKGLSFSDFVALVAKYTEDYGEALRSAMRIEVTEFRDYVNKEIDLRLKDLRRGMDEECNYESAKIKKDIEKWKSELGNVKREVLDMIPEFDIDEYKADSHYLTKIFALDSHETKKGGIFSSWREESCLRLKWYNENTNKLAACNQQLHEDITCMREQISELQNDETVKQQTHSLFVSTESKGCIRLHQEIDSLNKEILEYRRQMNRK